MTPELAASRGRLEARVGARRVMEPDTESWLGLRAERIAVFRRKLRQGECRYRDIASVETVTAMVADGYTHIRSVISRCCCRWICGSGCPKTTWCSSCWTR